MSESESEFHLKTAKKCFNEVWDYLEKKDRGADDEQRMLNLAHAARYHWSFVGTPKNLDVNDSLISRVYSTLKQSDLALGFAKSALKIFQENDLSDVLHTGFEAMARAYATAKDYQSARNYLKKAREQLDKALGLDVEDKKIYLDQIRETEKLIEQ